MITGRRLTDVDPSPRAARLAWVALALTTVVGVVVVLLVALHLRSQRDAQLNEMHVASRNLARAAAGELAAMLDTADAAASAVADEWAGGAGPGRAVLAARVLNLPRVRDLIVLGPNGSVLASSRDGFGAEADTAGPAAVAWHAADRNIGVLFGPPSRSAVDGAWQVAVSRRFDVSGRFGGIVLAHVALDEISRSFAQFDLGTAGAVVVTQSDGRIVVRRPFVDPAIGAGGQGQPWYQDYLTQGRSGTSELTSPIDGVQRLNGWQELDRYPLVVFVALSRDEILADWRTDAVVHLGASTALMLLASAAAAWLVATLRRVRIAERRAASIAADFRLLAESSTDLVSRISLDGVRRYVSPASAEILGYLPQELVGTLANDFVHPWDADRVTAELRGVRAGAVAVARSVHRVRHKRGHWVWVEVAMRCRRDPDTGEMMDHVSSARDVTARRQAEEALACEEARYRLLTERTGDLIVRLDRDYRRTYVSPNCVRMLGYTQAELLSRSPRDHLAPELWRQVEAAFEAARRGDVEHATVCHPWARRDGAEVWMEVSVTHLVEDDGFVSVIRDVTGRKLAEMRLGTAQRLDALVRTRNDNAMTPEVDEEISAPAG